MVILEALFVFFSVISVGWSIVDAEPSYNPRPNPDSVVTAGQARFTVLTSRLIRMEWGQTVDSATLTFLNRYLPTPSFQQYNEEKWKVIETNDLRVYI